MSDSSTADQQLQQVVLSLVDHLEAMVAYWDRNQVCVFANQAYLHWFGKTRQEMIGISLSKLLGPLYAKNLPYIRAAYAGQVQVFEREIPTPDGKVRHSLATYTPHVVDGEVQGIFVHVADVSPLKVLEGELRAAKEAAERMATHDFLTGLPNRMLLHDRIEQAFAQARRTQSMVAGISVDLDNFKQVNDTYGHLVGDRLLVEMAKRFTHGVRDIDTVTRLGGDEFFFLLPDVEGRAQVEAIAQRVLASVQMPLTVEAILMRPSCSMGIALSLPEHATPERLIETSDQALYAAKALGKNRYAFAESIVPA